MALIGVPQRVPSRVQKRGVVRHGVLGFRISGQFSV